MNNSNLFNNRLKPNSSLSDEESLEKVDVVCVFNFGKARIYKIKVRGKEKRVQRLGLHYHYKIGEQLFHVFGVLAERTFYKLSFNTKTLNWHLLEEFAD